MATGGRAAGALLLLFLTPATALSGPQPASSGNTDMLAAHNAVRQQYGVPPLTWSEDLAAVAQTWAETLKQRNGCRMQHSQDRRYGENLAWFSGMRGRPGQVVRLWADEAKDFDMASKSCRPGAVCGHFTQVVWRDSRQVGCGRAQCGSEEVWVCNYTPPGNWVGRTPF